MALDEVCNSCKDHRKKIISYTHPATSAHLSCPKGNSSAKIKEND